MQTFEEALKCWEKHHTEYLTLRLQCKLLEQDIEEKKLEILTAEENKNLKLNEKRNLAKKYVLQMQQAYIQVDHTKNIQRMKAEKYQKIIQYLLKEESQ